MSPMGGDPSKGNQRWKCVFQEEKRHITKNHRALKTFQDYLIQDGHLKKFVDQEKTKVEAAEVKPNPRFDRDIDEVDDALEEDLPLGTIHMIEAQIISISRIRFGERSASSNKCPRLFRSN